MGIKKYVTLQGKPQEKWFVEKVRFSIPQT